MGYLLLEKLKWIDRIFWVATVYMRLLMSVFIEQLTGVLKMTCLRVLTIGDDVNGKNEKKPLGLFSSKPLTTTREMMGISAGHSISLYLLGEDWRSRQVLGKCAFLRAVLEHPRHLK